MPMTRRAALAALVVGLSGCAASPVISGTPALAPSPPPPKRSEEDEASHLEVSRLATLLAGLGGQAGYPQAWWAAALAQCEAHEHLLALPDPFSAETQQPFVVDAGPAASPGSAAAAGEAISRQLDATVAALGASASKAVEGDARLLYASAAAATTALKNRSITPGAVGQGPVRLQATGVESATPIALGHAWALIYGLGVGIGRLGTKDQLRALGVARLAEAKTLRNELRAAVGDAQAPEQPAAFALPTPMTTPDEIRKGWAKLETNLLDGYARVVAASDEARWRTAMLAQVTAVQAVGGALGAWPGWVA